MDRMNDEFFRPRGLYCLIMAYNPINMGGKPNVDPAQAMEKHKPSSPSAKGLSKVKQNIRNPVGGVSQGEDNLPDTVATLVFPDSAKTPQQQLDAKTKKMAFARLNDYFDRRAQARYVGCKPLFHVP